MGSNRRSLWLAAAIPIICLVSPCVAGDRSPAPLAQQSPDGLQVLLEAAPQIYVGSEPLGESSFRALAALGIRTVISVDGAKPRLDAAAAHQMRYVHIPLGYDGIPAEAAAALARVAREVERPLYFHCHQGKHRGPAAAAVACIAADLMSPQQATAFLERAGTSKRYRGLWRDVADFLAPSPDEPLPQLFSSVNVGELTDVMVSVERRFSRLSAASDPHQALLLGESLREARRLRTGDFPADFWQQMAVAEKLAHGLEAAMRAGDPAEVQRGLTRLSDRCAACHSKYRDR